MSELPVSDRVRRHLDKLAAALSDTLGEDLLGLYVYGSAARGEWREGCSDLNLLVETSGIDFERIDILAGAMSEARKRGRIEPLLLTEREYRRGADAFAVLVEDIRRDHVPLCGGEAPLQVRATPAQLRLGAERELRYVHMRIRRTFLGYCSHSTMVDKQRIHRDFTRSMASLRALCVLSGLELPPDTPGVIDAVGGLLGCDVTPLHELFDYRRERQYAQAELAALSQAFSDLLDRAIHAVDTL